MIVNMTGDIMNTDALVLIQQVKCDGSTRSQYFNRVSRMYPGVANSYRYHCKNNKPEGGDIQSLFFDDRATRAGGGYRIIVNCYFDDEEGQKECIKNLLCHYKNDKIAIPENGGDWNYGIIEDLLSSTANDIQIWG